MQSPQTLGVAMPGLVPRVLPHPCPLPPGEGDLNRISIYSQFAGSDSTRKRPAALPETVAAHVIPSPQGRGLGEGERNIANQSRQISPDAPARRSPFATLSLLQCVFPHRGRTHEPRSRGAGCQPAVSPTASRLGVASPDPVVISARASASMPCRLATCETADWQSALRFMEPAGRV